MLLLALPGTLLALVALLVWSAWAEEHLISSRALIVKAARDRRSPPEHAEALVAREFATLLRRVDQ